MPSHLMRRTHHALVSLGSNVDPERWVPIALRLLTERFSAFEASGCFVTPAVGGAEGQAPFVNAACTFQTDLHPRSLRLVLRSVESRCERVRGLDRCAPRTMDLDPVWLLDGHGSTLLFDASLGRDAHVLVPSAELWPERVMPGGAATLAESAADLDGPIRAGIQRLQEPLA